MIDFLKKIWEKIKAFKITLQNFSFVGMVAVLMILFIIETISHGFVFSIILVVLISGGLFGCHQFIKLKTPPAPVPASKKAKK